MNIASIDIKGAYDGVDHEFLFQKLNMWRRLAYLDHETLGYIRFLYSEYKLTLVEHKNGQIRDTCLINVGVPQGSRLSCSAFNGVEDSILRITLNDLRFSLRQRHPTVRSKRSVSSVISQRSLMTPCCSVKICSMLKKSQKRS